MGKLPQIKEITHNCNIIEDKRFIDKFPFQKININPTLSNVILHSQSNQTDVIKTASVGFSFGSMLLSNKLKILLEKFNLFGVQFFSTYVIHKNQKIDSY